MALDDAIANRKSKTSSMSYILGRKERIEDLINIFWLDTLASVRENDFNMVVYFN